MQSGFLRNAIRSASLRPSPMVTAMAVRAAGAFLLSLLTLRPEAGDEVETVPPAAEVAAEVPGGMSEA